MVSTAKNLTDSIGVVQVNYCTAELVVEGLKALEIEKSECPNLFVVIVDNFSPDDSVLLINTYIASNDLSDWVSLIQSERNGGFSFGNNLGIQKALNIHQSLDFIWLLNPDTLVRPGATRAIIEHLKSSNYAIAGSQLENFDGSVQISTFRFPSVFSEFASGFKNSVMNKILSSYLVPYKTSTPEWLAGASMVLRRNVVEAVGGWDEGFFLYFEEIDYLKRAHQKGFDCTYVPSSRVVHMVGSSTGISDTRKKQPRRPKYWFDSRRRYFTLHHGRLYLLACDLCWIVGYSTWLLRKKLFHSHELSNQPPKLLADFTRASDLNPNNWRTPTV